MNYQRLPKQGNQMIKHVINLEKDYYQFMPNLFMMDLLQPPTYLHCKEFLFRHRLFTLRLSLVIFLLR